MRLMPNIRFGTEGYPEKVARRLRATNIAAWIGAATLGLFAVLRFVQGFAHWKVAFGLAPLLHRFGPLALTAIVYAWAFWLSINGGVANGTTFIYFMAGALGILLIGAEHVYLCILLGAVAVGLLIFLHVGISPLNTIEYPTTPLTFVINVVNSSTILFLIVFYAVRQFTRAEERAEREHERSEALLTNILPRASPAG
jgi:adenylate cyclase